MKILILTDRYPPYYEGGYELSCEQTAKGLVQKGHQIFILTTIHGVANPIVEGNVFRLLEPCRARSIIDTTKKYLLSKIRQIVMTRKNYLTTKRIIKEIEPDIVYIWQLSDASMLPVIAVQEEGVPYAFEIQDYSTMGFSTYYDPVHKLLRRFLRFISTGIWSFNQINFENMIFVSNAVKLKYINAGFQGNFFEVIYNGIERSYKHCTPKTIEKNFEDIKLLYVGRIVENKGVHIAIEAVACLSKALRRKNLIFDIVGSGDEAYIKKLKKKVEAENLQKIVRFIGKIPHNEVLGLYKDYDILLFTSIWEEPFGMTVLEAMAEGLPVIAARVGGVPEIINDRENGLLVAPNDASSFCQALKSLIENQFLYKKIRLAGLRIVQEKFLREHILNQIENFLLNVSKRYKANRYKRKF